MSQGSPRNPLEIEEPFSRLREMVTQTRAITKGAVAEGSNPPSVFGKIFAYLDRLEPQLQSIETGTDVAREHLIWDVCFLIKALNTVRKEVAVASANLDLEIVSVESEAPCLTGDDQEIKAHFDAHCAIWQQLAVSLVPA